MVVKRELAKDEEDDLDADAELEAADELEALMLDDKELKKLLEKRGAGPAENVLVVPLLTNEVVGAKTPVVIGTEVVFGAHDGQHGSEYV